MSKNIRIELGGEVFLVAQNISWDLQQEADDLAAKFVHKNRFSKRLRSTEIPALLVEHGILSETYEKELEGFSAQLKKTLVNYFLEFNNKEFKKKNSEKIAKTRQAIAKIRAIISPYETSSLEFVSMKIREDFILSKTVVNERGNPLDDFMLDPLKAAYYKKLPSTEQLRKMARSDPWSTMWSIKKADNFAILPLSDYQIMLAFYSRMYDNVNESPERPSRAIIDDDDALDGWFIHQSEKPSETKTETKKHAEEIVFTNDPEKAREIYESNSQEMQAIQRLRMRQLQNSKSGVMKIGDFKDIQAKKLEIKANG